MTLLSLLMVKEWIFMGLVGYMQLIRQELKIWQELNLILFHSLKTLRPVMAGQEENMNLLMMVVRLMKPIFMLIILFHHTVIMGTGLLKTVLAILKELEVLADLAVVENSLIICKL